MQEQVSIRSLGVAMLDTIGQDHERSYWDRYNVALTSNLSVLRDAAEIALVLAEIDQERNDQP